MYVTPAQLAVQVGQDFSMSCVDCLGTLAPLLWYLPSGQELPNNYTNTTSVDYLLTTYTYMNDSRITYNGNGSFSLVNANETDTGVYACYSLDMSTNINVTVTVYIMPDYIKETIILLAVNGGLLLIFIACSVYTAIENKRETKIHKKKPQS